jgi:signal transduction histidine kinase
MFQSARLKLTAWYLAILLTISISFSAVIYRSVSTELDRFSRVQRFRIERRLQAEEQIPEELREHLPPPPTIDLQLIEETRRRFFIYLALVNAGIAAITGVLGYFLAGKTLQPIQSMVDEQNRFIGDASHELRTPLTSLKTTLEVALRDKQIDIGSAKKLMSENLQDVNRLQLLSEQLLQLTQFEKPNEHFPMKKVHIPTVVQQAIRTVQPLADAKSITLHPTVVETSINGNAEALVHLLVIILDNAIKYSHTQSTISLAVTNEKRWVCIQVSDSGIGISEKDLDHVFDRFYRADEARTQNGVGGYGLGLSIAHKIVQSHHGTISIESKKSKGTTVSVRFQNI